MKVHRTFDTETNMDAWFAEHHDDPGVAYAIGSYEHRWQTNAGDSWVERQQYVVFELDRERQHE